MAIYTLTQKGLKMPALRTHDNTVSWLVIKAMLQAYTLCQEDNLATAVSQHVHGTEAVKDKGGMPFVRYMEILKLIRKV